MSKIIETMNNPFRKEKIRTSAQEEIAKIYLKVSDKGKNKARPAPMPKLPWIIAAAALVIALLVLFFKSNIDVKVRILGEIPTLSAGGTQADKFGTLREKGIFLVKDAEPNKYIVRSADFKGDAKAFSKMAGAELILCNSRGPGWANYEIELKEPINLARLDLKYVARGERGDEFLTVVVVDSDNRTYRVEKDISSSLTKDWQVFTVNFMPLKNAVDIKNISVIRFEFGSLTVGNSPMATIFMKDICVTKTKRMGW